MTAPSFRPPCIIREFPPRGAYRSPCRSVNPQERPADVIPLRPMLHYDMTRNVFSNFWSDDEGSLSRQAALALAVAVSIHLHTLQCALNLTHWSLKCLANRAPEENFPEGAA